MAADPPPRGGALMSPSGGGGTSSAHHTENEWDDEDSEIEAERQHERDNRHQPTINHLQQQAIEEAAAASEYADAIVPIEAALPALRQQSTEDESELSDSESSDGGSSDDQLVANRAAPRPPAAVSSVTPTTPHRASPPSRRYTPIMPSEPIASVPISILQDAMANPPPPPTPSSKQAAAATNGKPRHSPGSGNVITLSLKKEPMDDTESGMDDTHHDETGEETDSSAFVKAEDTDANMSYGEEDEEEEEEEMSSSSFMPAVKLEADEPNSNKITLTIPRRVSPAQHPPAALRSQPSPPPPASAAAASSSIAPAAAASAPAAAAWSPPRAPAAVIPPTTALTSHGKAALERYRSYFFDRDEPWPALPVNYVSGREVTDRWVKATGLRDIFIATNANELGIKVPAGLTVRQVVEALPPQHELSVIDVAMQTESGAWTLAQWLEYYETPAEDKTAICNVISLEISGTDFAKQQLLAPKFARDADWIGLWPKEIKLPRPPAIASIDALSTVSDPAETVPAAAASSASGPPFIQAVPAPIAVQLYCLMGAGGSYTDFHADFGGSSVWYHVVRGEKIFLAIEPTAENMEVYEQWHQTTKQLATFLPDLYAKRDKADGRDTKLKSTVRSFSVKAGQTLYLPSGWIHAVYTPVDSLVFGGNFLHSYAISSQLLVYNIELNTHIEARFKYPNFEAVNWLVMREYVRKLREPLAQLRVTLFELRGLASLVKTAAWWMKQAAEGVQAGIDASRPRLGSKFDSSASFSHAASAAVSTMAELCWEHNIPFSWSDALTLLRELDIHVTYNVYLIEREEHDDHLETEGEASAASAAESDHDNALPKLSPLAWLHREQLATKCFAELQLMKAHAYELVEMIDPTRLVWLKPIKPRKAEETDDILDERAPLIPTASGRSRQPVSKWTTEFLSDAAFVDDEPEAKDAGAANTEGAPGSSVLGTRKRTRIVDDDDEADQDDDDEDDGDFFGAEDDDDHGTSDEEFAEESAGRSRKKAKTSSSGSSRSHAAAPAAPVLSDIRARAQAAAAASMSQSKKVILATAPVKRKPSSGAKPKAPAAPKAKAPTLSAKQRIMGKLGLSGKLR